MHIKSKDFKLIISFIFIFIVFFLIFKYKSFIFNMNVKNTKKFVLSYGKYSALFFVALYSLKPIVFIIPASILSIMAGNVFGSLYAFLLSMTGCFLAGTFAFSIAKLLGKPFVDNMLGGRVLKLDSSIEEHGFIIILLMRLSVVFAYDPLSYACGLTKMKYKDFILGTLLGIIPEMLAYSFMGDSISDPLSLKFILPIVLAISIAFTSYFTYKKYKKKS